MSSLYVYNVEIEMLLASYQLVCFFLYSIDPVRVQFCLDDSQWPRRQQKIWELGPRYQEIWKEIPL